MTNMPSQTRMPLHTNHEFEEELHALKDRLLAMGGRCERMIDMAIRAYDERSEKLAHEVMRLDREMNVDECTIDDMTLRLLALRQPMGRDLRFAMLAVKVVTDLERIGDEAVNLAERVREMVSDGNIPVPSNDLPEMARRAAAMLHDALDAFVEEDADKALAVLKLDDIVDETYGKILRNSVVYMEQSPTHIIPGMKVSSCAKYVERIADHATNIAEMVVYLVSGVDVRHQSSF
jgi:phosphate transport system protein